jgi:hypothetical protein
MPLRPNEIDLQEFLFDFAGGGNETRWNEIVSTVNAGGDVLSINGVGGAVSSVNGQIGGVTLEAADIPFTAVGTISATNLQAAIAEIIAEGVGGGGGGGDLSELGNSVIVYKIWDGDSYEWSGGVAPTNGFTNIMFQGPQDPIVAPGGRDIQNDIWIDTAV